MSARKAKRPPKARRVVQKRKMVQEWVHDGTKRIKVEMTADQLAEYERRLDEMKGRYPESSLDYWMMRAFNDTKYHFRPSVRALNGLKAIARAKDVGRGLALANLLNSLERLPLDHEHPTTRALCQGMIGDCALQFEEVVTELRAVRADIAREDDGSFFRVTEVQP